MELVQELRGHSTEVLSCSLSSDGSFAVSAGRDGCLIQWDIREGRIVHAAADHQRSVLAHVEITPDCQKVLSCYDYRSDSEVLVRQASTLRPIAPLHLPGAYKGYSYVGAEYKMTIGSFALSPDGTTVATADQRFSYLYKGEVCLWDLRGEEPKFVGPLKLPFLESLKGHHDATIVAFSGDSRTLVTVSPKFKIKLFDVATLQMTTSTSNSKRNERGDRRVPCCVAYAPDNSLILIGDSDGLVHLYDGRDCQPVGHFEAHSMPVACCSFSQDSQLVATAGIDGTLKLWNSRGQTLLYSQNPTHKVQSKDGKMIGAPVNCCQFSGNSTIISCGGETVCMWKVM
eukprot:m51a1_g6484 hypothetical protein (342) ;mRNA; r:132780-134179